jgi:hypothetical protein
LALSWAIDTGLDAPTLGAATIKAEDTIDKLFDPVGDKLSDIASKAAKTITASLQRVSLDVTASKDVPTPGTDPHGNPGTEGLNTYASCTYFDQVEAAASEIRAGESDEGIDEEENNNDKKDGDGKRDEDKKDGDEDGNDTLAGIGMF